MLGKSTVEQFAGALRGRLIQPDAPDYDAARSVYNAMIDRRPALIARCVDVADVIAAVTFAREHALPLAVRGGGHSGPGLGVCDDGLVVDLSPMKGVRVDPACAHRTRRRRLYLGRCRSCHARLRPGDAERLHFDDGSGWPDVRRRHRLSVAPLRPDHRQPDRRGHGARRRSLRDGKRRRERRPVLGGARRRRQLRRRDVV